MVSWKGVNLDWIEYTLVRCWFGVVIKSYDAKKLFICWFNGWRCENEAYLII